jgi:hypothetical protein
MNKKLQRVKEERNILRTVNRRKAIWIGHILGRDCFLKQVIEGKIEGRTEVTGRRERRRKQLLDDYNEKKGYWKLKGAALDRTVAISLWNRLRIRRKEDSAKKKKKKKKKMMMCQLS